MITKQITLRAHCTECKSLIFKKFVTVNLEHIGLMPLANKAIELLFPPDMACDNCETHQIERSYIYHHTHKFSTVDMSEHQKQIDRCKAQIASTWDTNSEIPKDKRAIIRQGFQEQLKKLLEENNVKYQ